MKPLGSFRVVELGIGPVTGLAGMVLADFGAEVIKVNPVAGDPFADMPSSNLWLRGKKQISVDLNEPSQVSELRELILQTSDAVITTLSTAERTKLRLDNETLRESRSDLVIGAVSGFGERGPLADYPGYEGLVAAKSGRMMDFSGIVDREGPVYSALQVGVHASSQSLAAGLLAALENRTRTGHGHTFHTSLLRGMMPYEMGVVSVPQLRGRGLMKAAPPQRVRIKRMPTFNYHPVPTKDNRWLQFGNLLPHLLDNYFRVMGFKKLFTEERYKGDPLTWDPEDQEQIRDEMFEAMQTRDLQDWMDIYVKEGSVAAHPYQSSQEALSDPDIVDNKHVVETQTGKQLGLVANLLKTPGKVEEVSEPVALTSLMGRPLQIPRKTTPTKPSKPLEGVTVVESAAIIAAPLGASTLADLGARVIKIEPPTGDPFRSMSRGVGAAKCNTGKESICLDLKSPHGQKVAQQLATKADIWIHNYRVGVPEKLGIGYDQLSSINEKLVYISANGYGPNGPGAKRPSTHPIPGAALGGVVWQIGGLPDTSRKLSNQEIRETARTLLSSNDVNPDPNTSMVIATTATLGLCIQRLTGTGQKIFVDMFGANAYANWDDFLSYENKPERPQVDKLAFGLSPLYRLYECESSWVFLGVVSDKEKQKLETHFGLDLQSEDLAEQLSGVFRQKHASEWEAELIKQGIGCVRADENSTVQFFLESEQARADQLLVPAEHAEWGSYMRLGPMVEFDAENSYPGASLAGDSTHSLLSELGYSSQQIEEFETSGVIRAA